MLLRLLHFAWSASLTFIPSMSSRPKIPLQNSFQAFELKKSDDRNDQETQRILLQNSPNAFRQMNSDHRKDIEPQQALLQNSPKLQKHAKKQQARKIHEHELSTKSGTKCSTLNCENNAAPARAAFCIACFKKNAAAMAAKRKIHKGNSNAKGTKHNKGNPNTKGTKHNKGNSKAKGRPPCNGPPSKRGFQKKSYPTKHTCRQAQQMHKALEWFSSVFTDLPPVPCLPPLPRTNIKLPQLSIPPVTLKNPFFNSQIILAHILVHRTLQTL